MLSGNDVKVFKASRTMMCMAFFFLGNISVLFLLHLVPDWDSHSLLRMVLPDSTEVTTYAPARHKPPWGDLEAAEMPLVNLLDSSVPNREKQMQKPVWHFENLSEEQVKRFIKSSELSASQRRTLLNKKYWNVTANDLAISPPESLILSLDADSRQRIYTALAKCGDNYPQSHPYRFNGDGFETALKESGVDRLSAEKLRQLSYTNYNMVMFADQYVAQRVMRTNVFENFLKTISRIHSAYSLRLRVRPDSDLKSLANYWGKGGREYQVGALLKALARLPNGGSINIGYLLPPFPRLRLYTYPYFWDTAHTNDEDCFFSSFNFFSTEVQTNLYNVAYANQYLQSAYQTVNEHPTFGDLISLVNPHGDLIHMCVYIADDFVFTKNGSGRSQPWVLMKLPDVNAVYFGQGNPGKTIILRHKEPINSSPSA